MCCSPLVLPASSLAMITAVLSFLAACRLIQLHEPNFHVSPPICYTPQGEAPTQPLSSSKAAVSPHPTSPSSSTTMRQRKQTAVRHDVLSASTPHSESSPLLPTMAKLKHVLLIVDSRSLKPSSPSLNVRAFCRFMCFGFMLDFWY